RVRAQDVSRDLRRLVRVGAVVAHVDDLDGGVFGQGIAVASDAVFQVRLARHREQKDLAATVEQFAQQFAALPPGVVIVRADVADPFALRRVWVDAEDRSPAVNRPIDHRRDADAGGRDDYSGGSARHRVLELFDLFVDVGT